VFTRSSRYRDVDDLVVVAPDGSVATVKEIRPLPRVTGSFRHLVAAGDRLDHLAETYYARPLHYWRICDANPDVLSPLALLGDEPVVTTRFPISRVGPAAERDEPEPADRRVLPDLVRFLSDLIGVENAVLDDDPALEPDPEGCPGAMVERHVWSLRITHNRLAIGVRELRIAIQARGHETGEVVELGRLGQEIVIPPAVAG